MWIPILAVLAFAVGEVLYCVVQCYEERKLVKRFEKQQRRGDT